MDAASFLAALGYVFPAYVANASPVVGVKIIKKTTPIDFGKNFVDGRRVLGDGKTFEGFVVGVSAGVATGLVMRLFAPWLFTVAEVMLLSVGALLGDIGGAFIKRRIGLNTGSPAPVLDQVGFLATAILLVYLITGLPIWIDSTTLATLFIFTVLMHIATNSFAYFVGLKDRWY